MRKSILNSVSNSLWGKLKELNGVMVKFVMKSYDKINDGIPLSFEVECVFSGEFTKYVFENNNINSISAGTVKVNRIDLESIAMENVKVINKNGDIGTTNIRAPVDIDKIKSKIDYVEIDGIYYRIQTESQSGIGNIITLDLIRK